MKKIIFLIGFLIPIVVFSQVGIGTIVPKGALDVTSSTNGVVLSNVALTDTSVALPVVNPQGGVIVAGTLVWNTATAGVGPNNVIPGYYYWDGSLWIPVTGNKLNAWLVGGNGGLTGGNITTAGTNFIGTTDAQNLDIRTANTFRARFSSLGEFFVGTLNTTLVGDLMNGVGNATFPWAVNGYTSFASGGTYGLRQAGSTGSWGAIQGELDASIPSGGSGVNGLAAANNQYGVRGSKPAGGLGFGGLFINDLGYSGGVYNLSDERLKKNVAPLQNVLSIINKIPFYTFNFKTELYDVVGGDEMHYGVMAAELKEILPNLVKLKTIDAGQIRSAPADKQLRSIPFEVNTVNYLELIPIAIQGIKEQQLIIENQNSRIEKLEKMVSELLKNKK